MPVSDFERDVFKKTLTKLIEKQSSVAEICRRTGINRQQFHKYLNGNNIPTVSKLFLIARVLNVSLEELLGQSPKLPQDNRQGLDELLSSRCVMGARQVAQGTYLEISTYDQEQDTYLTSALELQHTVSGGTFFRKSNVDRLDGTSVEQELRGYYFEAGEKIMMYYANMTIPNALGVLCLRRLDTYGCDLVGIKAAHRVDKSRKPMAAPVALHYLGEKTTVSDIASACGVLKFEDLPSTTAIMVNYLKSTMIYEGHRLRI